MSEDLKNVLSKSDDTSSNSESQKRNMYQLIICQIF